MIEVSTLLEDSDTKAAALEKVAELEEDLSHVSERRNSNSPFVPSLIIYRIVVAILFITRFTYFRRMRGHRKLKMNL